MSVIDSLKDGSEVPVGTGAINFGEPGTNGPRPRRVALMGAALPGDGSNLVPRPALVLPAYAPGPSNPISLHWIRGFTKPSLLLSFPGAINDSEVCPCSSRLSSLAKRFPITTS